MFFKNKNVNPTEDHAIVEAPQAPHELYGTYFVVTPETNFKELVAIQNCLKNHAALTFKSMPIADIQAQARRNGEAYVCIDAEGCVSDVTYKPSADWRQVTFFTTLVVQQYKLEPLTVEVLGKRYNKKELEAALRELNNVSK